MATINSKKIILDIIDGKYACDNPTSITRYTNNWGSITYGVTFGQDSLHNYQASPFVLNPEFIWTSERGMQNGYDAYTLEKPQEESCSV